MSRPRTTAPDSSAGRFDGVPTMTDLVTSAQGGYDRAMAEVAAALGLETVSLDDLRAMAALLDERDHKPPKGEASDTLVYGWAVWRDPVSGLYHRARMHPPLALVLEHAIKPLPGPDYISRVAPAVENDLVSETFNRGRRWDR